MPCSKPLERLLVASLLLLAISPASATGQTFAVANYVLDRLYLGNGITALDFGPTGILYLAEKQGRVLAALPDGQGGYQTPQVFLDLRAQVDSTVESGLLGLAVDPDFTSTRHIYLFYTTATDQRLARTTANAAGTSGTSPSTLLTGLPRAFNFHKAGDIQFRPGEPDNIYISLGDDGFPGEAQSLTSYRGKMLRVSKSDGNGLATNPYIQGTSLTTLRSRLWAIGFRNPFRFAFHPVVGQPRADVAYVSENGDSTDKVSWVRAGSNGAWSAAGDNGGFLSPPDAQHRVLFTGEPSNIGLAVAASGPFSDGGAPVLYLANWFPNQVFIRRWRLGGADLSQVTAVAADRGLPFVSNLYATAMRFGPDGALYFTQSSVDAALGPEYDVGRIRFVGGDPPVAAFTTSPSPAAGPVPFTVAFTDTSTDRDGTIQAWEWDFGDGARATARNPTHVFAFPGTYTVTLSVTDNDGLRSLAQAEVDVANCADLLLSVEVLDGRFLDGRVISPTVGLELYQGDGATPLSFSGGGGTAGNSLTIIGGRLETAIYVEIFGEAVVSRLVDPSGTLKTQTIGFPVVNGVTFWVQELTFSPSTTALRGRVTDTRGDPATVDIGVARTDVSSLYPIAGGRDYLASSGIPPTGVRHRRVTDRLGYYYLPFRDGGRYFLDVVGDTNADQYVSTALDLNVALGAAVDRDIVVALQEGGAGCDNLSGISSTPNVDYATQIQPIWDFGCIGCHRPNSANGGGLALTSSVSWSELVNVPSTQAPGLDLVRPGVPSSSYLLEKISCNNPQVGARMRPGSPMPLADQALVRDWIAQGALRSSMGANDAGVGDVGGAGPAPSAPRLDAGIATGLGGGASPAAFTAESEPEEPPSCTCALSRSLARRPMLGALEIGGFAVLLVVAARRKRRAESGAPDRSARRRRPEGSPRSPAAAPHPD